MARVRRISAFIRKVLLADKEAKVMVCLRDRSMSVVFFNALAKDDICSECDDLVSHSAPISVDPLTGRRSFLVYFDLEKMGEEPDRKRGQFSFDNTQFKRDRRAVTNQEHEGANLIGGRRHVGSGAISGLKSDASSEKWQQEAKSTRAQSFGLKLGILDKLTREARAADKDPMLFLRFTEPDEGVVAEDDWVIIPKSVFERMEGDNG